MKRSRTNQRPKKPSCTNQGIGFMVWITMTLRWCPVAKEVGGLPKRPLGWPKQVPVLGYRKKPGQLGKEAVVFMVFGAIGCQYMCFCVVACSV